MNKVLTLLHQIKHLNIFFARNVTGYHIQRHGFTLPSIRPRKLTTNDPELAASITVPSEIKEIEGTPEMQRVGCLGRYIGMTARWDKWGQYLPLSVVRIEENIVLDVACESNDGFNSVMVAGGYSDLDQLSGQDQEHESNQSKININKKNEMLIRKFQKYQVSPRKYIKCFRVTKEGLLPHNTVVNSYHYIPGQYVDVYATTKNKGFQGVIKRWGFNRQPESHGNSKTTRCQGSIGSRIGKVHKGKKMPGQMGGKNNICYNLKVFAIDHKRNLMYLEGSVGGERDGVIRIRDSFYKKWQMKYLPMPTYIKKKENKERLEYEQREPVEIDPLEFFRPGYDDDDFDN